MYCVFFVIYIDPVECFPPAVAMRNQFQNKGSPPGKSLLDPGNSLGLITTVRYDQTA
jgi:hypothetical protein